MLIKMSKMNFLIESKTHSMPVEVLKFKKWFYERGVKWIQVIYSGYGIIQMLTHKYINKDNLGESLKNF